MKLLSRFEERTGLLDALKRFGRSPVPARGGWLFTLGSACTFLLAVQFLTGAFLAAAYAPTPDHARASVYYIQKKMPSGGLVRGLHHWGASALIILVALHLARVAFHGAYKSPRQESWWTGLLLLLFVLAFAFTGYLLPWDQKGYWATVVGVRIAGTTPAVGPWLSRLLAGGPGVGAPTLTRFTAIHCIFLPAAAAAFVGLHLYLLRRHGHAGLPGDVSPREAFFPWQMSRDTAVCLAIFAALLVLARGLPASLESAADPSDTSYVPRPDWYFLFLFQLLHYFKGKAEVVGTVLIPVAVFLFLFGLPLWDRSAERAPSPRRSLRRHLPPS
jgi:quinol-cytochrome oxidoreductase complex cytochrome b subunit